MECRNLVGEPLETILEPSRTAIVVVDVQEHPFCVRRYRDDILWESHLVEFLGGVRQLPVRPVVYWVEYEGERDTLPSLKKALGREAEQKTFEKTEHSAMSEFSCGLPMALRRRFGNSLAKDPATLVVMGLFNAATDVNGVSEDRCVAKTAIDAMRAGYRVVLPRNGHLDLIEKDECRQPKRIYLPGKFELTDKSLAHRLWEPPTLSDLLGVMRRGCGAETMNLAESDREVAVSV